MHARTRTHTHTHTHTTCTHTRARVHTHTYWLYLDHFSLARVLWSTHHTVQTRFHTLHGICTDKPYTCTWCTCQAVRSMPFRSGPPDFFMYNYVHDKSCGAKNRMCNPVRLFFLASRPSSAGVLTPLCFKGLDAQSSCGI